MFFGLSKDQVEQELKVRGVQDESLIKAFSEVIDLNNKKLKESLPYMLKEVERKRKRVSLTGE
ncbi:hypothetical protein [Paenibacillus illinoisensis]|uniref:hypothetical protein n=1 Tax=Paenibacillus illinoisensis TaxID=59845 RepID=UPI00301DD678